MIDTMSYPHLPVGSADKNLAVIGQGAVDAIGDGIDQIRQEFRHLFAGCAGMQLCKRDPAHTIESHIDVHDTVAGSDWRDI